MRKPRLSERAAKRIVVAIALVAAALFAPLVTTTSCFGLATA